MTAVTIVTGCQHSELVPTIPDAAPPDLAMPPRPDLSHPGPWSDFPGDPVFDSSSGMVPDDAPALFANAPGEVGSGPCIVEPEPGTAIPLNWIRPRVRFIPVGGQNLFEIRLHASTQDNDLVVYTSASTWTMPAGLWRALTSHIAGEAVTVTVRAAVWDGARIVGPTQLALQSSFRIAPVPVSGAIIYSSASGNTAVLRGADVGQEVSRVVLRPSAAGAQCIGCHAALPDAVNAGFVQSQDGSTGTRPSLGIRSSDGRAAEPGYLTAAARLLLGTPGQDALAFTRKHFTAGDRVVLSTRQVGEHTELVWTDLEASSVDQGVGWGVLTRENDQHDAAMPTFTHDGSYVLYVSGTRSTVSGGGPGGNQGLTDGDLLTVPWSSREGGTAAGIRGARESKYNEYAPSLSPDDRYVAFARVPVGETSQANPRAEVAVVPFAGGAPSRLEANDPPACTGRTRADAGNSWPRFSPDSSRVGSTTWYWVAFSSKRGARGNAQIYVSAVIVDENQQPPVITSTPALYLWSQPANEANHTPSWEPLHLSAE